LEGAYPSCPTKDGVAWNLHAGFETDLPFLKMRDVAAMNFDVFCDGVIEVLLIQECTGAILPE
jgi:hypothetical protein